MKKFLTVLLVIAVMFTFSFSSAMAETTYTASEVLSQLTAEKTEQVKFLNNTKATLLQAIKVNEDGFGTETAPVTYWTKAAYEKAADAYIKEVTKVMDAAIRTAVDAVEAAGGTVNYIDRTVVSEALVYDDNGDGVYDKENDLRVKDVLYADVMKLLMLNNETAYKAGAKQAKEDVKTFVEGKLTADLTKYNAEDKIEKEPYNGLTAADYVQKLIDDAKDAMDEITKDTVKTDAQKAVAYAEVYYAETTGFKALLEAVPTLEDEKVTDAETAKDIAGAAGAWLNAAIAYYNDAKFAEKDNLDTIKGDGSAKALLLANEDIYEEKAGGKAAKLFGVDIANRVKMTKAEAIAVNNAMYDAMVKAADALKAAAKTPGEITVLYDEPETIVDTLAKSMLVAEKIADVEKAGEKMKGTYSYGLKTYDDEAVTKAVEAAKKLVYKALLTSGTQLKEDAKQYIFDAAYEEDIDLYVKNFEKQKFLKAIQDAIEKMFDTAVPTETKVAVKVPYGEDKTPEADLVYLAGTYADSELEDWTDIAKDTRDALFEAQTYAEIDEIMADAAKEFGKLMLKKDASDVEDAQEKYLEALNGYYLEVYSLKGDDYKNQLSDTALFAYDLILNAKTVDGVKAAYEEAKKILDNVKSDDEMDDATDAIKAKINALPFESQLTLADKDAVVEAYNAYMEYLQVPGAEPQTEETVLKKALEKILTLEKEAYEKEIKDMKKALDALAYSDADRAEYLKLKADVAALVEKVKAHNDFIEDVEEGKTFNIIDGGDVEDVVLGALDIANEAIDIAELEANLFKAETEEARTFWEEEITAVSVALVAAGQDGATVEQMKAALEAYKGLTDRQKYNLDASVLPRVKVIEQKLATAVKGLKLTASSKATKGAITVKWTVKGDKTAADGYQIWKSTKMNSGYKKAFTTTKMSYKNSKGLKKGVKYYYKVRAYKVVDGKNVYSDWSNKAYRTAK